MIHYASACVRGRRRDFPDAAGIGYRVYSDYELRGDERLARDRGSD
jgi:hypothetical protein